MKNRRKICDFTTSRQKIDKVKANGHTSRRIGAANTIKHGRIKMKVSANSIDVHAISDETMGTFLIASYSSVQGNTSHYRPILDNNIKLCPNTIVSA